MMSFSPPGYTPPTGQSSRSGYSALPLNDDEVSSLEQGSDLMPKINFKVDGFALHVKQSEIKNAETLGW